MADRNPSSKDAKGSSGENKNRPRATYLTDEELEYFRQLILQKRRDALAEIEMLEARLEDAQENSGGYTYHMADSGTDAMEKEMLALMISRLRKYIGYLDRALDRIANKTYGICKITGKPIPKERLEAVPHTETTVEAKLNEKRRRRS
ncbi:MAG: TraR/DksA family transcriptional regulator [Calditrichaeota bacterium]|nr:MAG: TraR/DksA family transcriptional regulator [Calditrichota bacterium]